MATLVKLIILTKKTLLYEVFSHIVYSDHNWTKGAVSELLSCSHLHYRPPSRAKGRERPLHLAYGTSLSATVNTGHDLVAVTKRPPSV